MDQCFRNLAVRSGQAHQQSSVPRPAIDLTIAVNLETLAKRTSHSIAPARSSRALQKLPNECPQAQGATEDLANTNLRIRICQSSISCPCENSYQILGSKAFQRPITENIVSLKPVHSQRKLASSWLEPDYAQRSFITVNAPTSETRAGKPSTGIGNPSTPQFSSSFPKAKNGPPGGSGPVADTAHEPANEQFWGQGHGVGARAVVVVTNRQPGLRSRRQQPSGVRFGRLPAVVTRSTSFAYNSPS